MGRKYLDFEKGRTSRLRRMSKDSTRARGNQGVIGFGLVVGVFGSGVQKNKGRTRAVLKKKGTGLAQESEYTRPYWIIL